MLAPALATMLCVLTTDAEVDAADRSTGCCARPPQVTFDRIDSDGCMSTNDTVRVDGQRRQRCDAHRAGTRRRWSRGLRRPARQLLADAEGATQGGRDRGRRRGQRPRRGRGRRAVARNNLLKCALFGDDPNWGRVLAAVGTTEAAFDPDRLDVAINGVWSAGAARPATTARRSTYRPRRAHPRRPARRRAHGDDLDQRPVARLRRRELGVLAHERTARHIGAGARRPTLVDALPWLERFHGKIVVIKYGGNAMTDAGAAARRSPRTSCSCATPACVRSSCTAAARRSPPTWTGSASSAVPRRAAGHHARRRWTIVRMVLVGQVNATSST